MLQHITVAELLAGNQPKLPLMYKPYIEAKKQKLEVEQGGVVSRRVALYDPRMRYRRAARGAPIPA